MKLQLPSTTLLGCPKIEIHYTRPYFKSMTSITQAEDAVDLLRKYIHPQQIDLRETFWVILLSYANRVLGVSEVVQGTAIAVQTNVSYIFQLVLLTASNAFIIAHTHSSGGLVPSERDITETKRIQQLAKIMEVTLLDHLIITSESFTSLARLDYI